MEEESECEEVEEVATSLWLLKLLGQPDNPDEDHDPEFLWIIIMWMIWLLLLLGQATNEDCEDDCLVDDYHVDDLLCQS